MENVPIDMLPILVNQLKLTHRHTSGWSEDEKPGPHEIPAVLTLNGSVELRQGRLISIIGPHSNGKSTLLKVFGGALLPDMDNIRHEEVFVPSHLRVLHIPPEAVFFRGSLMDNVTYGVRPGDPDGEKSRVKAIFRHLVVPGNVISLLEEDSVHYSNWYDVLSTSQLHLLSIVRALVANPQVICIHKPTEKYSEEQGKQVLGVLKLFVEGAGLEQDQSTISKKKPRPRTCIMTNVKLFANDYADDIIMVTRAGVSRVDKESIREDMIG
jgi:ABC-type polar amino acid transport system ATPase subunit